MASRRVATGRFGRAPGVLILLSALLILAVLLALGSGAVSIAPGQTAAIVGHELGLSLPWSFEASQQTILLSIRAPRLVLGMLVGASLAMSGGAVQGLFRNPLADPALIGIASGAALAAVATIVLQDHLPAALTRPIGVFLLPGAAIVGGFATTWLIYRLAGRDGQVDVASLLLAGIAINALAGSVTGLLVYVADDDQLRNITFWSLGSLGGATWKSVALGAPFLLINVVMLPLLATPLNALLLGEAEAGHLGFAVARIKTALVGLVALGVGSAVALSGVIGFVGLVVPHLLRLALGPDHRWLLPGSGLLGAALLLGADTLARTLAAPAEMPIGVVTGLLGSPFFLWLLFRQRLMAP